MEALQDSAFKLLQKVNFLDKKEKEVWSNLIIPQMTEKDLNIFIDNLEKRMDLEKEYLETLKTKYLKAQGILSHVNTHIRFKNEASDRKKEMENFQELEKELTQA